MLKARVPLLAAVAALLVVAGFVEAGRGSGGTYSLPAGNPVVSGTTITTGWANSTLQDIGTEITNSLDRAGRGAMQAPLKLTGGTSTAPGLTFSSDNTSGLFLPSAGDVRMSVTQSPVQRWTSTLATIYTPLTVNALTTTTTLRVTSTSDSLSIAPTTTNTDALTATGTGTGRGGVFASSSGRGVVGSSSSDVGVAGSSASSIGVYGYGPKGVQGQGTTTGVGVEGITDSSLGVGVRGIGGTGDGVDGTATSGIGVYGLSQTGLGVRAVSSSGRALQATSLSSTGVFAQGTIGLEASPNTGATINSRTSAIKVTAGDIEMSTLNPLATIAVTNRITPANIPKAWASFDSSGNITSGLNVSSVSHDFTLGATTVTFASAISGYSVSIQPTGGNFGIWYVTAKTSTSVTIAYAYWNAVTKQFLGWVSANGHSGPDIPSFDIIVMGVQ